MKYQDFLKEKPSGCTFCTPPADRVIIENEQAFVTYSIAALCKHHIMVIPKRHVVSVREFTKEESRAVDELMKKSVASLEKLGHEFTMIFMRNGPHPGKSMEHLHYQLVPQMDIKPHFDIDVTKKDDTREILTSEEINETLADFARVS